MRFLLPGRLRDESEASMTVSVDKPEQAILAGRDLNRNGRAYSEIAQFIFDLGVLASASTPAVSPDPSSLGRGSRAGKSPSPTALDYPRRHGQPPPVWLV